ncbi:hypothetical protein JOS77_25215 [Chromobacterium haemolyticum]|nr:hypothetical protein JOS77_25215 [Chromobacterium haemolyticum]
MAKQAMLDARLVGEDVLPVDKDRVGVILGGAGNGNTSFSLAFRQQEPYLRKVLNHAGLPGAVADEVIDRVNHLYLEWNEDSFPGFLGNVACGRIASYFDLGGTSYMVDAACASSLAAIKAAVGELVDGSCDVVLTGGVNLENSIFSFLCFSKTPALVQEQPVASLRRIFRRHDAGRRRRLPGAQAPGRRRARRRPHLRGDQIAAGFQRRPRQEHFRAASRRSGQGDAPSL